MARRERNYYQCLKTNYLAARLDITEYTLIHLMAGVVGSTCNVELWDRIVSPLVVLVSRGRHPLWFPTRLSPQR